MKSRWRLFGFVNISITGLKASRLSSLCLIQSFQMMKLSFLFALFLSDTFWTLRACSVFRHCPLLCEVNHVHVVVFSKCVKLACELLK